MNPVVLWSILATAVVAGCNNKPKDTSGDTPPPPTVSADGNSVGSGNIGVIPSGAGGGIVTSPGGLTGGGGGGTIQQVRKAARRAEALNELAQLGVVIEDLRDPFGKMPSKDRILAALRGPGFARILEGITAGSYILTGTIEGGGLWAYEVDADMIAGVALIGGRALRTTPDDLRQYFTQK
jgi:hypothetical protein